MPSIDVDLSHGVTAGTSEFKHGVVHGNVVVGVDFQTECGGDCPAARCWWDIVLVATNGDNVVDARDAGRLDPVWFGLGAIVWWRPPDLRYVQHCIKFLINAGRIGCAMGRKPHAMWCDGGPDEGAAGCVGEIGWWDGRSPEVRKCSIAGAQVRLAVEINWRQRFVNRSSVTSNRWVQFGQWFADVGLHGSANANNRATSVNKPISHSGGYSVSTWCIRWVVSWWVCTTRVHSNGQQHQCSAVTATGRGSNLKCAACWWAAVS